MIACTGKPLEVLPLQATVLTNDVQQFVPSLLVASYCVQFFQP